MTEINSRHKGQYISTYPKETAFFRFVLEKQFAAVLQTLDRPWNQSEFSFSSWVFLFEGMFGGGFRNELVMCNNERKLISFRFQAEQAT